MDAPNLPAETLGSGNGDLRSPLPLCRLCCRRRPHNPEVCCCGHGHPPAEHMHWLEEDEKRRAIEEAPARELQERWAADWMREAQEARERATVERLKPLTEAVDNGFNLLTGHVGDILSKRMGTAAAAPAGEAAKPPTPEQIAKGWLSPAGVLRAQPKPKARFESTTPALNKASRGGYPTGALVVVQGPPDAGKTGEGLQDAVKAARENEIVEVIFTPDQGREPTAARIGALLGLDAGKLEERDEAELERLDEMLRDRNILLPDDSDEEQTVEAVIAAGETIRPDLPHILFLDSLQEARPNKEAGNSSERERVIANVRACQVATKSAAVAWLVIATSQTTKASSSGDPRNRPPKIAAAAESFKIAFAAQLVVHLDGDPAQGPDFGRGSVVKNKLGGPKPSFGLRLDPATTRLEEIDGAEADRQRNESASREREKLLSKFADRTLALLLKHGPLKVGAILERVGGRKADLLDALAGLEAQGAATWTKGPRNAHVWEAVRRG